MFSFPSDLSGARQGSGSSGSGGGGGGGGDSKGWSPFFSCNGEASEPSRVVVARLPSATPRGSSGSSSSSSRRRRPKAFNFSGGASRRNPKPAVAKRASLSESESGDDAEAFSVPSSVKAVLRRCAAPSKDGVAGGSSAAGGEGAAHNDGLHRASPTTPSLTSYSTGGSTVLASSEDGDSFRFSAAIPAANASQTAGGDDCGVVSGAGCGGYGGDQRGDEVGVTAMADPERSPPPARGPLAAEEDEVGGIFVCSSAAAAAAASDGCAGRSVDHNGDPRECSSTWTGEAPVSVSVPVDESWSHENAPAASGGEGRRSHGKPASSVSSLDAVSVGDEEDDDGVERVGAARVGEFGATAPEHSLEAAPGVSSIEGDGTEARSAPSPQRHLSGAYLKQLAAFNERTVVETRPHDVSEWLGAEPTERGAHESSECTVVGEGDGHPDGGEVEAEDDDAHPRRGGSGGGRDYASLLDQQVGGGGSYEPPPPGREGGGGAHDVKDLRSDRLRGVWKSWTAAPTTAEEGSGEFARRRELRKASTAPATGSGSGGGGSTQGLGALPCAVQEVPGTPRKSSLVLLGLDEKSKSFSKFIATSFRRRGNNTTTP